MRIDLCMARSCSDIRHRSDMFPIRCQQRCFGRGVGAYPITIGTMMTWARSNHDCFPADLRSLVKAEGDELGIETGSSVNTNVFPADRIQD